MDIRIEALGTALPEYEVSADTLKKAQIELYGDDPRKVKRLHRIVDSTGIEQRAAVAPVEYLTSMRPLAETEDLYLKAGIPLAEAAARKALDAAGRQPEEIDVLLVTSCTGVPIPGIDADLVNRLGMRRDIVRLPITQLGCAGGAVGLARAAEILKGRGGGVALTVAVELPTLTFQRDDNSMSNLVATCIFGDGAAAVVMSDQRDHGLTLRRSRSHHFEDSRHLMGFAMKGSGFHIVLDKTVPNKIESVFPPVLESFLAEDGKTVDDLGFHAVHPGGTKIIRSIEKALGLEENGAIHSRGILRDVGNLSSATVLFVLERVLQSGISPGTEGLIAAFGPGFAAEIQVWQMV